MHDDIFSDSSASIKFKYDPNAPYGVSRIVKPKSQHKNQGISTNTLEKEIELEEDSCLFELAALSNTKKSIKLDNSPRVAGSLTDPKMVLMTQVIVKSPQNIPTDQLMNIMSVFYLEKTTHTNNGFANQTQSKNEYYSLSALLNVFKKYTADQEHSMMFYILTKFETVLFASFNEQKFALIKTKQIQLLQHIEKVGIRQYPMIIEETRDYVSLIRYRDVRVFFNAYMSYLLKAITYFEIISNFKFNCCQYQCPIIAYSGNKAVNNNIEFQWTLKGYFFNDNIQKLRSLLPKNVIKIEFKALQISDNFEKVVAKGFQYQDQQDRTEQENQNQQTPSFYDLLRN